MKTRKILIISAIMFAASICFAGKLTQESEKIAKDQQFKIICSPELTKLTGEWVQNYTNEHPGANISWAEAPSGEIKLDSPEQIAIVKESQAAGMEGWKMTLGREIIVPVISKSNPYASYLLENGATQGHLKLLVTGPERKSWGILLGDGEQQKANLYVIKDESVISSLEAYLQIPALDENVTIVENYAELLSRLAEDPLALAFCNFSGIYDNNSGQFEPGIMLLPIDRNANGKLDNIENIYADAETFQRGVWIGKYPAPLVNNIYFVSSGEPQVDPQISFLSFIFASGQKSLVSFGLSELVYSEAQSKIDKLSEFGKITPPESEGISVPKLVLFIVASLVLLAIVISALFGFGKEEKTQAGPEFTATGAAFDERSVHAPGGLFYSKSHTWAFMEKDGSVKTGVDEFIPHITGPVTRIEMKKPGDKVTKGEIFLSLIQKGKQLKLYAPVSGKILECNSALQANAGMLNSSPYYDAWVYRIEPSGWLKEIPLLSMAEKYSKWISEEFGRLRDFLAFTMPSHQMEPSRVILQDGGALKNYLLEDLGPEVWEDFQDKFIDQNK